MTLRYLTPRPDITVIGTWDGSNLDEVTTFLQTFNSESTAVVNEDGTITTTGGIPGHPFTHAVGGSFNKQGIPFTNFASYQQLLNDGSYSYTVN